MKDSSIIFQAEMKADDRFKQHPLIPDIQNNLIINCKKQTQVKQYQVKFLFII